MAIKNRADLLAFLREKAAYTGGEDLAAVKSFVNENVELSDESGNAIDVETIWNIVPKSKVKAVASATAQADEDEARLSGAHVVKSDEGRVSSKATRTYENIVNPGKRDVSKKAYEARVRSEQGLPARQKTAYYTDADTAEAAGAWFRLAIAGNKGYAQRDTDESILGKTLITTTNSLGGATVPNDFQPTLIDIRKAYGGLIGSVIPITPMSRDTLDFPRQTGNLTVYAPGEATAGTASDLAFDNVSLVARKMMTLTQVSSELMNDSAINIADTISRDIVWSFAKKQEECLILGDGTNTYFTTVGMTYKPRLVLEAAGGTWTTDANKSNLAGWVAGAGNAFSELTLDNHNDVIGRYTTLEGTGNPSWICSPAYWRLVMQRLAYGVGGVTSMEVINGIVNRTFLGFPVHLSNAMPSTDANSQVCALFGDYAMGAKVGEVTGSMSIASSEEYGFNTDTVYVRGITRYAQSVHDVGNYSATAASRVAGPICGLITTNS